MSPPLELEPPAGEDRSARAASLRSRAAVQAGDREAWLALFTPAAVVADQAGRIESLRAYWQFDQMRFEPVPPALS